MRVITIENFYRYERVLGSNFGRTHRIENIFNDGIKYVVFTDKSIRLLGKNQYTSNVESGSTRT